ncbi:MAG: precorrin-6A reductase [Marinifilaceae bacterium]|jgi:precorrin-6A/cobalt-precorrin-6A reductase|nr:precorrin-6A reductase [Marinifilaceae bacterium]
MILIIGGTIDAVQIAGILSKEQKIMVSTTTRYGAELAKSDNVVVSQLAMDLKQMQVFFRENNITKLIDASHPFAAEVSENAMKASVLCGVQYYRYEREIEIYDDASYYSSYDEMVDYLSTTEGNILLTIGSKNVNLFSSLGVDRLIARVLPVVESLDICERAGLSPMNIIAMKGRISSELNQELIRYYNIKHVVSKDSGKSGGVPQKIDAARKTDVEMHILRRPQIEYPRKFSSIEMLISNLN